MENKIEKMDKLALRKDVSNHQENGETSKPETRLHSSGKAGDSRERAGIILKREREKQGLSLELVHETTKIPLDTLRAIEEDYTVRMLSPFYYSGFVKMYAHYLNIDVSEVIEDYKEEELPEHIDQYVEEFEIPQWITQFFTRERKQQIAVIIGALVALVLLFTVVKSFTMRKPQPVVQKETQQGKAKSSDTAVSNNTSKAMAPPKATSSTKPVVRTNIKPVASVTPVAALQKDINLTVRANQNSWLRVKTDGTVVFQSTLRTGAVETWLANDEIEISGRHINQLEFELNGKMIGTLGRNDRNAKKVIITKNGLSVKK